MQPVTIRKTIEIAAPPTQVWRYIGTAAGLQRWWGVAVALEEREGGQFEERGEDAGRPYHKSGEVLTYDPPRQLVLRCNGAADGNWPAYTEISISLTGNESATTVEVVHQAFAEITVVATDASVAQESIDAVHGPTMALPGYAGTMLAPAVPMRIQPSHHATPTLQALYGWRHGQEQVWQQRVASLVRSLGEYV